MYENDEYSYLDDLDNNDFRAMDLIEKYTLKPDMGFHSEIKGLLIEEIENYNEGSSEYIRVLCAMLYCIGKAEDATIIKRAKYSINMDVGCMIDIEWIEALEGTLKESIEEKYSRLEDIIEYYKSMYCL